jgi:uncharacterized protein YndB with AHSA1/START domain
MIMRYNLSIYIWITAVSVLTAACLADTPSSQPAADPLHRLHARIETPEDDLWQALADPAKVSRWLFADVDDWTLTPAARFSATMHSGRRIKGTIVDVQAHERVSIDFSDNENTLTLELTEDDVFINRLTLTDSFLQTKDDQHSARQRERMIDWQVALMKLHDLFPPPVVETQIYRPQVEGLFITRSLIVNGSFEQQAPGKYKGVAYGWETTTASSSPDVHKLDSKIARYRGQSQCISNPPDWTHFAIQQWTPPRTSLIVPGRKYHLEGWVRAEGIRNPAGWYRLGLWFMNENNQPIGDFLKNVKVVDESGTPLLNHDWRRYTIDATAPAGAARAVVILSGHWGDGGQVWYDDVSLWPAETPPSTTQMQRYSASQPAR